MRNRKQDIIRDLKDLGKDLVALLGDIVEHIFDLIIPKYIQYLWFLHDIKKHMWTKQYLRQFEISINSLVDDKYIKPYQRDKLLKIARRNSELGYEKYKWCFECSKRRTKECNMKVCYSEFNKDGEPKLFNDKTIWR